MSTSSLAPATTLFGSIATAGSFCLFCENGVVGLPTVTRVSLTDAATATAAPDSTTATAATAARTDRGLPIVPPGPRGPGPPMGPGPDRPRLTPVDYRPQGMRHVPALRSRVEV